MVAILYKWLMVFMLADVHPIFVSVTEIEHNAKEKSVGVSCKIFTDDFENTLRKVYNTKIDLLNDKNKPAMTPFVNGYIQKHLVIKVDGKTVNLQFLGFEQQEEGIVAFYEAANIPAVKSVEVMDNILYESKEQQMGIIHVTVNGQRKSTRLNNPDTQASFAF